MGYKITSLFSIADKSERYWTITLDEANGCYCTSYGMCDIASSTYDKICKTSKEVTTKWKYSKDKNIGRSNYVSARDQASLEVERLIVEKKKEGFFELHEYDQAKSIHEDRIELMLATDYEEDKVESIYEKFSREGFETIFLQPKLDGVRCYTNLYTLSAKSRNHNILPLVEQKIRDSIRADVARSLHAKYGRIILDGEIYKHGLDIGEIISCLRVDIKDCRYHIFDVILLDQPEMVYSQRLTAMIDILDTLDCPFLQLVQSIYATPTGNIKEIIDNVYDDFSREYEGLIIRFDGPYQMKRSKMLLKLKKMMDREFTLVDFIEGEGQSQGIAASAIVQLSYTPEDLQKYRFLQAIPYPPTCKVNVTGTLETRREYLDFKDDLIGKQVTVQFQSYIKPSGMIRFGELKNIRDYE